MKNVAMVILVGILSLGLSFSALAAKNYQPHSAKTFMGKKRPVKTVVSQSDTDQTGTSAARTKIKHYQKTYHRISGRK